MAAHRRKNRGFTLIETLIVVGVIAVLAAVSLPLFMDAIEKAHIAADEAYERAAIAKMNAMCASGEIEFGSGMTYSYDAENDRFISMIDPEALNVAHYGRCHKHKDAYLWITTPDPTTGTTIKTVEIAWITPGYDIPESVPHYEEYWFNIIA